MRTLTVTAKGQVTLRKDILKHLGIGPGAKVVINKLPDRRVEIKAAPAGRISDAFGILKGKTRKALSLDEIKEATARGWAGKR
jgi:AbrB family looped-hinge helix DNA binding protein